MGRSIGRGDAYWTFLRLACHAQAGLQLNRRVSIVLLVVVMVECFTSPSLCSFCLRRPD